MRLLNIGFGNMVSEERVVSILSSDSSPIRRMMQQARDEGRLIDATNGRKCRTVLVIDSGHVVLSGLPPETVAQRAAGENSEAGGAAADEE